MFKNGTIFLLSAGNCTYYIEGEKKVLYNSGLNMGPYLYTFQRGRKLRNSPIPIIRVDISGEFSTSYRLWTL